MLRHIGLECRRVSHDPQKREVNTWYLAVTSDQRTYQFNTVKALKGSQLLSNVTDGSMML